MNRAEAKYLDSRPEKPLWTTDFDDNDCDCDDDDDYCWSLLWQRNYLWKQNNMLWSCLSRSETLPDVILVRPCSSSQCLSAWELAILWLIVDSPPTIGDSWPSIVLIGIVTASLETDYHHDRPVSPLRSLDTYKLLKGYENVFSAVQMPLLMTFTNQMFSLKQN